MSIAAIMLRAIALFKGYFFTFGGEKAKKNVQKQDIEELIDKAQKISALYIQ